MSLLAMRASRESASAMPMLFHIDIIGRRRRAGRGERVRTRNLCRARMQPRLLPPCMGWEGLVVVQRSDAKTSACWRFVCLFVLT